jgi:hypothetical protein
MTTYLGYAVLVMFGHLRDFFGKLSGTSRYFSGDRKPRPGYAPLLKDWENFYTRRLYHRIQDCWNRPIVGPPTAKDMVVVHRTSTDGQCTMRWVVLGPVLVIGAVDLGPAWWGRSEMGWWVCRREGVGVGGGVVWGCGGSWLRSLELTVAP